jgi:hypothetical protein
VEPAQRRAANVLAHPPSVGSYAIAAQILYYCLLAATAYGLGLASCADCKRFTNAGEQMKQIAEGVMSAAKDASERKS